MLSSKQAVKQFLSRVIRHKDIADDDDIFALGLVNSMFAMEFVLFIEKTFNISIANEDLDLDNFRTINAVSAFIQRKKGGDVI